MILIGITGLIASGKSTVSSCFNSYGVPVIDADTSAKRVVEPGTIGWKRVKENFGNDILLSDGKIDRQKLGEIIFSDRDKRILLNKCLHGLIAWDIFKQILIEFFKGHRFIILDIPLLFDSKFAQKFLSYTIVCNCNGAVINEDENSEQLRRLLVRDKTLSVEDAMARIKSQSHMISKMKSADFIIDNSADLENIKQQVKELHNLFAKSSKYIRLRIGLLIITGIIIAKLCF